MSTRSSSSTAEKSDGSLPNLGSLNVNCGSYSTNVDDWVNVDSAVDDMLSELDSIEGKRGRDWFVEGDEEDEDGARKKQFDEKLHKSIILEENKEWMKYYPPANTMPLEEYDYKNWTRFYPCKPSGGNHTVKDPHWKNPLYPRSKHATLSAARAALGDVILSLVNTSKKSEQEKAETAQESEKFKQIIAADGETSQFSGDAQAKKAGKEKLSKSLLQLLDMLRKPVGGFKQPLHPRNDFTDDMLPPGWVYFLAPRTPENAVAYLKNPKNKGSMGGWKYGDNKYCGPHWETWDVANASGEYEVRTADAVKDAWLIYAGYGKSAKSNDPNEKKTAKDKTRTEATKKMKLEAGSSDAGPSGAGPSDAPLPEPVPPEQPPAAPGPVPPEQPPAEDHTDSDDELENDLEGLLDSVRPRS